MRTLMVARGDGAKAIWITEFSAPTSDNPLAVSPARQAAIAAAGVARAEAMPFLGGFFWYQLRDSTAAGRDHFGLLRADGTPKPAYAVYARALARARAEGTP